MIDSKLSSIISYKLPDFVQENYPLYVAFVQAYVEFLENDGNILHFMQRFQRNLDPDLADDDFLNVYKNEFLKTFPNITKIPTSQLLTLIKEFYLSKGSEDSFKFIFNILYGKDVEIIYPREFMLIPSNSDSESDIIVYITGDNLFKINFDNNDLAATLIGNNSNAEAIINSITTTFIDGQNILRLDISSYSKNFNIGENVQLSIEDNTITETVLGSISEIKVINGGTNYNINDKIIITDNNGVRAKAKILKLSNGGLNNYNIINGGQGYNVGDLIKSISTLNSNGYGFRARVYSVDSNGSIEKIRIEEIGYNYNKTSFASFSSENGVDAIIELNGDNIGKIESIQVVDGGLNYNDSQTISVQIESEDGEGVILEPKINTVFEEPQRIVSTKSAPSGISRIQDSYYYQQFSYVAASDISPNEWLGTVKRIAHPAGNQLFGMFQLNQCLDLNVTIAPLNVSSFIKNVSLNNVVDVGLQFTSNGIIEREFYNNICPFGSNYSDLDNIKFLDTFKWNVEEFKNISLNDIYGINSCADVMIEQECSTLTII